MLPIIDELLESPEPSVRWRVLTGVLDESSDAPRIAALRTEIADSPRVRLLLAGRGSDGRMAASDDPYARWTGGHWVLSHLADLGYPAADASLAPLRDHVVDHWLTPYFHGEEAVATEAASRRATSVPVIDGRHRVHASQQGNALRMSAALGFLDDRAADLARLLLRWQWSDGGWNCDRDPVAHTSSFHETLLALRGLARYANATGNAAAHEGASRAAEFLLERRLLWRRTTGTVPKADMALLHYPRYWHYDVLGALIAMVEVGAIGDPRCGDALDLLESKRLADGGWRIESRYDTPGTPDRVDWGSPRGRHNPWVTAEALVVLRAARRLSL